VTRIAAVVAALAAMLLLAPAAFASTYLVDDPTDPPATPEVVPGDDICDVDPGAGTKCTLRGAIQEANAHAGADTIGFLPAATAITAQAGFNGLDAVNGSTTFEGAGVTVTFDPTATGPLFSVLAADVTLRGMTITGGAAGAPAVSLEGARDRLDKVSIQDVKGDGVSVSGADVRLDLPLIARAGGNGVLVTGPRAVIDTPEIFGSGGDGINVQGDNALVSAGKVHDNGGNGVSVYSVASVVSRVILYGNAGKPIALVGASANNGITPPADLRIGPRRADGSLPLTGSTPNGGTVELFHGNPFNTTAPALEDVLTVGAGTFTYGFKSEPPPGDTWAVTLTGSGTSEFTTVSVPSDVSSPDVIRARALSTTDVRVFASEPLDPASLQPEDFTLTMAGGDRKVTAVSPGPDPSSFTLTSSGWRAGEAGYVTLAAAGAIADAAGNASLATTRLRVAAAPGDFIAPIGGQLRVTPTSVCLTRGRGCRAPGMVIRFSSTEEGKATVVVQRGNKRVGSRLYSGIEVGPNSLKFNGRLGGRKLRAGRYRLLVYPQDPVGNVTPEPPITLFSIRRVTK